MSDSRDYLAVKNLQAALLLIAVDAGYHFDVASTAVKLDPDHAMSAIAAADGPRPLLMITLADVDKFEYQPSKRVKITLPLRIHWIADSTPTDDNDRIATFFAAADDIERAVSVDLGRGGYATDTRIVGRTLDTQIDGVPIWATVDVELIINRTYGATS